MHGSLRLAFVFAIAVVLYSSAASAAFMYYEVQSSDTQQCAQASVEFVQMYECDFCFASLSGSESYMWKCNMTNAEKLRWFASGTCQGQPDSSVASTLYVCNGGFQTFVAEGPSDQLMNGILDLAFAPGKIFTQMSYFHSSDPAVCPGGQNAPELVATAATFCSSTSSVFLCNLTHVERLSCEPGCGAGTCTVADTTPMPCIDAASGQVKLSCRIDVQQPPQGVAPPSGGGNPFPDFPPSNGNFPPGFIPPPSNGNFPPGFIPPPFDGNFPPGFIPPPGDFPPGFIPPPSSGNLPPSAGSSPSAQSSPVAPETQATVRVTLKFTYNASILEPSVLASQIRTQFAFILQIPEARINVSLIASGKRAISNTTAEVTISGSAVATATTALFGAGKDSTIASLTNRLTQIPGVQSVSNFQAAQVNPPTGSSTAPVKPAAPSNAKASESSSISISLLSTVLLIGSALLLTN